MTIKQLLFSLCLLCFYSSYSQATAAHPEPYDWEHPTLSFEVDEKLNEISGLSMDESGQNLLAIQDELGELFVLDRQTGRIIQQIPFWNEGDYEGVEQVGEDVYVVKSSGTLYQISDVGTASQNVIKYNGFLNSDNDIEGLGYWPQRQQLLLACKAQPGVDIDPNRFKAIYAFDLATKTFLSNPIILLDRSAVEQYLSHCKQGPHHHKLCDIFSPEKEDFDLSPTAMAVHPLTGDFYLTSSKGNLLLIISSTGEILHIDRLPKALHRQPEGLCFDVQGNLYISNERKKESPPIVHFYAYDPNRTVER